MFRLPATLRLAGTARAALRDEQGAANRPRYVLGSQLKLTRDVGNVDLGRSPGYTVTGAKHASCG